jgi:RHS repeat-associated protein
LFLERETLHGMDDQQRIALIETKTFEDKDGEILAAQKPLIRYQLGNHLGSAAVEVDSGGSVISCEEYYPYGNTAYQAVVNSIEVSLKRYRYTGKERDQESGLYYYGARYYAAWLGRWTSCDLKYTDRKNNLYQSNFNNPILYIDMIGEFPSKKSDSSWSFWKNLRNSRIVKLYRICSACINLSYFPVGAPDMPPHTPSAIFQKVDSSTRQPPKANNPPPSAPPPPKPPKPVGLKSGSTNNAPGNEPMFRRKNIPETPRVRPNGKNRVRPNGKNRVRPNGKNRVRPNGKNFFKLPNTPDVINPGVCPNSIKTPTNHLRTIGKYLRTIGKIASVVSELSPLVEGYFLYQTEKKMHVKRLWERALAKAAIKNLKQVEDSTLFINPKTGELFGFSEKSNFTLKSLDIILPKMPLSNTFFGSSEYNLFVWLDEDNKWKSAPMKRQVDKD